MKPRSPEAEDLLRTATALRAVYQSILPRISGRDDSGAGRLGFSAPSYNRACVRTHAYFVELGKELGEWWLTLQANSMKDDPSVRRIVREYQEEAALDLAGFVAKLPEPQRRVVELKSSGLSWKRVMEHPLMKGRAYFSVMDDWKAAIQRTWTERGDLVRRLI